MQRNRSLIIMINDEPVFAIDAEKKRSAECKKG